MSKLADITNQRFGRATALRHVGFDKNRTAMWLCRCDCGNEFVTRGGGLRSGNTRSCGCLFIDTLRERTTKHGATVGGKSPEYARWKAMKERCLKPNFVAYARYGGRGIKVCDRWINSFENFLADMGSLPSKLHSLERKDVDGDYCPENCKWATRIEQANNTSATRWVTIGDQTMSVANTAKKFGISPKTLANRLRRGIAPEEAVMSPTGRM